MSLMKLFLANLALRIREWHYRRTNPEIYVKPRVN